MGGLKTVEQKLNSTANYFHRDCVDSCQLSDPTKSFTLFSSCLAETLSSHLVSAVSHTLNEPAFCEERQKKVLQKA